MAEVMSTRKPIRLLPRRKPFSMQSLALRSCSRANRGDETGYSFGRRAVLTLAVRTLHRPIRPGLLCSVTFRNSPGRELHHIRCRGELILRCSSATCSLRFSIEEALLWAGLLVGHFGGDLLSEKQALSGPVSTEPRAASRHRVV